jgi:hypothetical protein
MSKHTPGPWAWANVPTSCGVCFKIGPLYVERGTESHACIYADYPGKMALELGEANARLIAAAPELLEALKLCAAVCASETMHKTGLIDALEKALAAIAKVEGRS